MINLKILIFLIQAKLGYRKALSLIPWHDNLSITLENSSNMYDMTTCIFSQKKYNINYKVINYLYRFLYYMKNENFPVGKKNIFH